MDGKTPSPPPELGTNGVDRFAAVVRSIVGAAPIVGPALSEIATIVIPNQRADRFERYVQLLLEEISKLRDEIRETLRTDDALQERLKDPESVHLFEIGAAQAVQAVSPERLTYIAHLVARGMTEDQQAKTHKQRLLSIVGDLDDEEILILDAFGSKDGSKFDRVRPRNAHTGSSDDALDASAMYSAAVDKLERYSLLAFLPSTAKISEPTNTGGPPRTVVVPKLGITGRPEGSRTLTRTGRMLLNAIGLGKGISETGNLSVRPALR